MALRPASREEAIGCLISLGVLLAAAGAIFAASAGLAWTITQALVRVFG